MFRVVYSKVFTLKIYSTIFGFSIYLTMVVKERATTCIIHLRIIMTFRIDSDFHIHDI